MPFLERKWSKTIKFIHHSIIVKGSYAQSLFEGNNMAQTVEVYIEVEGENTKDFVRDLAQEIQTENIATDIKKTNRNSFKGNIPIDYNAIIITLLASGGLITTLVNLIQSKLETQRKIFIEIEGEKLELTGVSNETQQEITRLYITKIMKKQSRKAKGK